VRTTRGLLSRAYVWPDDSTCGTAVYAADGVRQKMARHGHLGRKRALTARSTGGVPRIMTTTDVRSTR